MAEREPVRNLSDSAPAPTGPTTSVSALDRPLVGNLTLEKCLYIAVFLIAAFNRLYVLGDRPFHHDESIHAFFSWKIDDEGVANYHYDPVYHGPVLYYASALVMKLFGDSDFTARLSAVFFGFGILAFAWPLRRFLGRWPALMFLVLVTFSPALTYFTRFIRHDVFVGFGNLTAVYFAFRYAESRKPLHIYFSAAGLAIAFCNKEDMYALGPVMVLSLILMLVWEVLYASDRRAQLKATWSETASLLKGAAIPILTGAIIFLVICLFFYTSLFTHRESWNPITPALKYWWGQHEIKRIGGPWYYYFPQLVAYEPLILFPAFLLMFLPLSTPRANEPRSAVILWYLTIVAFAGFVGCLFYDLHTAGIVILAPLSLAGLTLMQRWLPDRFTRFLCIWTIGCFGFYSWAQEKVPWLLFPILLPTVLLAAIWFGERIQKGLLQRPLPMVVTGALGALTIWTLIACNYLYSAPRPAEKPGVRHAELVAYVQSTYDIHMVMDRIRQVGKALGTGEKTRLAVSGNATWPLSWYLRHYPVNWAADVRNVDTPVVIIDKEATNALDKALSDKYEKVPFEIRGWWEPDPKMLNITTAVKWILTREAFSGVGSSDAVMYVLKDLKAGETIAPIAVNPPPAARGYQQAPSLDKPVAVWGTKGDSAGQFNE
ncbi:MAG TPA: flippase activity-associated protein Agl23, partial [Candidatus Acidoferrales bacterium]|nr:flippase activity-associated protein Agl23 [Candidatus Acidoferrales bacterium]